MYIKEDANRIYELVYSESTTQRHTVHLIKKPPKVSFNGSVIIYKLLILFVRLIGADRGHMASSASPLWEMKDLSLMFHNCCKCYGHKPNNINPEPQR